MRLLALIFCLTITAGGGGAGTPPPDPGIDQAVQAFQNGDVDRSRVLLRRIMDADPARVHPEVGAAAFWLGRVYDELGHEDSTRWAWRRGFEALSDTGRFDARLYDAFLQMELRSDTIVATAEAKAYSTLLRRTTINESGVGRDILCRHVAQAIPLLDESQRRRILVEGQRPTRNECQIRSRGGERLANWWARQDPEVTTPRNERLMEHLRRVAYAQNNYHSAGDPARWDDRGDVYIRYGAPYQTHRIPFSDLKFIRSLQRLDVGVGRGDFPKNEIWRYPDLGDENAFLFVKASEDFELSSATELLPRKLSSHFGASTDRTTSRAYSSLSAMRYVYKHLSMHYQDRGNVYSKVSSYLDKLENMSQIQNLSGEIRVPSGSIHRPTAVTSDMLRESERQEKEYARRRKESLPLHHWDASDSGASFPIAARTARYLTEQGETETEVYWAPALDSSYQERSEEAERTARLTMVRYDTTYNRKGADTHDYSLPGGTVGRKSEETVYQTTMDGATDLYHLGLQWDVYPRGEGPSSEQRVRRIVRRDSLRPLQTAPNKLEMSDLRLMTVPEAEKDEAFRLEDAVPYPYDTIPFQRPLVLYFELYHLPLDTETHRRYTVTYELTRQEEKGFLGRLFGGEDETMTSASTEITTRQSRTEEYIQLDVGEEMEGSSAAHISVRVTDEASGEHVERALDLTLQARGR